MNMNMEMEGSVAAVEQIIGYTFLNKKLLEEALTHTSYTESISYERLEFVGDAVLGLAISNHLFLSYTSVDSGQLSLLRAANVSTEKLARAAVNHGLHRYVRHNTLSIVDKIREFADAVERENDCAVVLYGGSVKAPKILADVVESIAAAVYVDVHFDLEKLWVIIKGLLEPIVTLDDLERKPQPVTMLFEICQKNGKKVDIRQWRNGAKSTASVYVDGELVATASSDQKDIARLDAAKIALHKLERILPATTMSSDCCKGLDGTFEIEAAKQKLYAICGMKKWPKPVYSVEKDEGTPQNKIFVTSVQIATPDGRLQMSGDEKSRLKDAQNSAASLMIRALQQGHGDGTLSVCNLRRNKVQAQSEFSEDELLSVVLMKNGRKVVCGSQTGIMLLYSWGCFKDCSDRFVDLSSNSIDTMLKLDEDRIITGSENGMINLVGILPNRVIQPIAEHSEYPVERLAFSHDRKFLGSIAHDQMLKLWDLDNILQGSSTQRSENRVVNSDVDSDDEDEMDVDNNPSTKGKKRKNASNGHAAGDSNNFFADL